MSNTIISFPDRTLTATLSGGSWQNTAPLLNLQDPLLSHVARSTNALATSSIILVNLGSALDIRIISLCAHNISASGTIRARGYSDSNYTTLVSGADTGTLTAWPAGLTSQSASDYPKNWTYCFDAFKTARYWKIEITDTTNPDGYIELGRCWLGEATFEPVTGITWGMGLCYESMDVIEDLSGIPFGDKRTPRRALSASFPNLIPAEKRQALIMQKTLTGTDEAFWITNSQATDVDMLLEAFPCFIRKASPITYPYFNNNEMPIEIIERI